jgi:AcrR family transcriptional regulator
MVGTGEDRTTAYAARQKSAMTAQPETDAAQRSLEAAGLALVERGGTPVVTIAEIAALAGIDPAQAATLIPSTDELLVRAAINRCVDELRVASTGAFPPLSAYARHFARHRAFYRAMRIGEVAALLDARMAQLVAPFIEEQIRVVVGTRVSDRVVATMTADVTSQSFEATNGWIVGGPETGTPESLYVRLEAIVLRQLEGLRTPPQG